MAPWTVVARSFRPAPRIPGIASDALHHHGRTIHTPGKISDLPLPHIVHLVQAATTSAALEPPVNRLAPHPQFQRLRLFVQFVPIHPVPRPRQNRSPFFVRQLLSVPKKAISLNHRYLKVFPNSCGEPQKETQKFRMFVCPAPGAYVGPQLRFFRTCYAHSDLAEVLNRGLLSRTIHDVAYLDWPVLTRAEQA